MDEHRQSAGTSADSSYWAGAGAGRAPQASRARSRGGIAVMFSSAVGSVLRVPDTRTNGRREEDEGEERKRGARRTRSILSDPDRRDTRSPGARTRAAPTEVLDITIKSRKTA
jgi:hypothetical protein